MPHNFRRASRIPAMRRLLALVLCLLIPLHGFAGLVTVSSPCPMQPGMSMGVDLAEFAQAMEDCCNDAATFELTGETCKPGQGLHAPAVWLPPLALLEFTSLVAPSLGDPAWRMHPPGEPTRLWRPPASV